MRIAVAADHAGYQLKNELAAWLKELGYEVQDLGTNSGESVALLKRAIRLAGEGIARDPAQDRGFDALFGSSDFRARLEALRQRR